MKNLNPWHMVPIGPDEPEIVQAIIEIPKESRSKYELDKETGLLRLDRVLYSSVYYPANYGFIPRTYGDDSDPLDILVLAQAKVLPLCIMRAKIIGVMRMVDEGEIDDKIIAVSPDDKSVSHISHLDELPDHLLRELRAFFEDYKKLEHKHVTVEEFLGRDEAIKIFEQSKIDYAKFMAENKE